MIDPAKLLAQIDKVDLPPVHDWNPPFCGDIDIKISRNGTWSYQGSPISRKPMVRLFSTILRKDGDDFYLVTQVEDAPFTAVLLDVAGVGEHQVLKFTDNMGNEMIANSEHPISVETHPETQEPSPYIRVRDNLEALICRNVCYQLVDLAEPMQQNGHGGLGVRSQGQWFYLGDYYD